MQDIYGPPTSLGRNLTDVRPIGQMITDEIHWIWKEGTQFYLVWMHVFLGSYTSQYLYASLMFLMQHLILLGKSPQSYI